jgi:hypothetical protein
VADDMLMEFLVGLGFKIDENSLNKFGQDVERATKEVVALGSEVVATALAVQVGVSKMARDFEQLYYAGQRTHSSVGALQSFEYAAKTIGVSSDQARGAVEGLSRAMRSNPGVEGLLNQLGVRTKGKQGTEILDELLQKLQKMPFYIAQQYAALAGLGDSDALLMLLKNYKDLTAAREDYAKQQKEAGVDADALAKSSHVYNNAIRNLEKSLDILGQRIQSNFIGPATYVINLLDRGVRAFTNLDKATSGWAGTLATIATTQLGLYIAKLLLLKTVFRGVAAEGAAAVAAAAAVGAGGAAGAAGAAGAGTKAVRRGVFSRVSSGVSKALLGRGGGTAGLALEVAVIMKEDSETGNKLRSFFRELFGIKDEHEDAPWVKDREIRENAKSNDNAKRREPSKSNSWVNEKRDQIVDFFEKKGWTKAQATGIATNLHRESAFNPKNVGDEGKAYGLAQWHADRQEEFKKWAGKDIRDSTVEDQLGFVHHELTKGLEQYAGRKLKQTDTARDAAAVVSKFYERPKDTAGEMASRGGQAQSWYDSTNKRPKDVANKTPKDVANKTPEWGDVQLTGPQKSPPAIAMTQKTDIHVTGGDATTTAKKVVAEQENVNANIVRNMGPVTR